MALDQFIVLASTGVASGQNVKNHSGSTNRKAAILIPRPAFPSDHRRGGRGAPYSLRQIRQPMVTRYELRIATPPRELIERSAVVEPMLMHARSETTTNETSTARSGIFQPC